MRCGHEKGARSLAKDAAHWAKTFAHEQGSKNLFVSEGLVTAEQRWALAGHRGWVVWLTGIDAPYEAPAAPDIHVRTAEGGIGDCVAQILVYLLPRVRLAAG